MRGARGGSGPVVATRPDPTCDSLEQSRRDLVDDGTRGAAAPQLNVTARTGGRPLATHSQRRPTSAERNTQPSSVPMATVFPRAATQPVSTLSENHSGSPAAQRSHSP